MKNKGFTLIELLAVIVILAIIALIAVPIVLNIINDARESTKERSRELYGISVENAVARTQLSGEEFPDGVYTKLDENSNQVCKNKDPNKNCITVEVDGIQPNSYTMIVSDGNIIEQRIKLNSNSSLYVKYENGKFIKTTRYYSWGTGSVDADLPDDATSKLTEIDTKGNPFYLAFDSEDGRTIDAIYVCFVKNEEEHCLKAYAPTAYSANLDVIETAFGNTQTSTCKIQGNSGSSYSCCDENMLDDILHVGVHENGNIKVYFLNGSECYVYSGGSFACVEQPINQHQTCG